MFLWLVRGDLDGDHKVSGVASGGEGATPITGLVDGGCVGGAIRDVTPLTRLEPNLTEQEIS